MLYRTLKRLIELGQTEGLGEKLDIFFAASKLTQAEDLGVTIWSEDDLRAALA